MDRFEAAGGYDADKRIANVLTGLGFKQEDWNKSCSEFSGGWQVWHFECLYHKQKHMLSMFVPQSIAHPLHVWTASNSTPCSCLYHTQQHTLPMFVPQATAHPIHVCTTSDSSPCPCLYHKRQHTRFMFAPQATAHTVHVCASQQCYTWLMQMHKGRASACMPQSTLYICLYTNLAYILCS